MMPFRLFFAAAFVLLLANIAVPPAAAEFAGKVEVIDGDTISVAGRMIKLYGIDAPELDQICFVARQAWPCGKEARWAVINRVSPHWVTCLERGAGRDGLIEAICYLAGLGQKELNVWVVSEGWAVANRTQSTDYVGAEQSASKTGKGLWRGRFIAPWDWRAGWRLTGDSDIPVKQ